MASYLQKSFTMPSFAFKGALVAVVMVFTYSALLPSLQVQAVDGVESAYFPTVVEVILPRHRVWPDFDFLRF